MFSDLFWWTPCPQLHPASPTTHNEFRSRASSAPISATGSRPLTSGADAAPRPTRPAGSRSSSARNSTTAGSATRRSRRFKTEVTHERPRTIITRNESPDISFDRSINPYRGCEHGCVYCFARPTHAYMGLSAGLDFESKLFVKDGAAALLEKRARRAEISPAHHRAGRQYRRLPADRAAISRDPLRSSKCWRAHDHPVGIVTKSNLVLRDLDLLAPMAAKGLAKVFVSVTTLDRDIARRWSRARRRPARRLEAIERLAQAGVPVGVMVAPDHSGGERCRDREDPDPRLCRRRARSRLCHAAPAARTARDFPRMARCQLSRQAQHTLSLVQSMHGGKDYDSQWGRRMAGSGPYAWMIGRRFEIAAQKTGLSRGPAGAALRPVRTAGPRKRGRTETAFAVLNHLRLPIPGPRRDGRDPVRAAAQ